MVVRSKGPKLNDRINNDTSRDNLGITSIQTTMQEELCPVVNTVTYRAFYWAFLAWNYYDYVTRKSIQEISGKNSWNDFNENCVKKNDYFFILGTLLNEKSDRGNLAGIDNGRKDSNKPGPYTYNRNYLMAGLGGMQYFAGGCLSMNLITDREIKDGIETSIPGLARVTEQIGKPLGEAFENTIKDTRYYREYRLTEDPVPADVLKELGSVIGLDMKGMDECKHLLRKALFDESITARFDKKHFIESRDYLLFLHDKYDVTTKPNNQKFREMLYDWFSPRGDCHYEYPDALEYVVKAWEAVVGRQYFTTAIEIICMAMISNLEYPKELDELRDSVIKNTSWDLIGPEMPLSEAVEKCIFDFKTRESMVRTGIKDTRWSCSYALQVLFSVYNRFKDREDIRIEDLKQGSSVSVYMFISKVDELWDSPVKVLLGFIMKYWVLDQNEAVAFQKLLQGRDGYIFERVGDRYASTGRQPGAGFQEIRLINLYQVMKDIDYLS